MIPISSFETFLYTTEDKINKRFKNKERQAWMVLDGEWENCPIPANSRTWKPCESGSIVKDKRKAL